MGRSVFGWMGMCVGGTFTVVRHAGSDPEVSRDVVVDVLVLVVIRVGHWVPCGLTNAEDQVAVCWCVGVLVCWCVGVLVCMGVYGCVWVCMGVYMCVYV